MANTYLDNGYCESACEKTHSVEVSDKVLIGAFVFIMVALSALILYGISMGFYIDPTSL